ncbi:hypothetical protein BJ742DRAFT_822560 [Cladochytrium replicatum]|nr:hypothetical protein BJ742DRAFT_822560 [Cladochytrium replicatum]
MTGIEIETSTFSPSHPMRIAIIGGGMGGLALAHGLMHESRGYLRVTVYERESPNRARPQGFLLGVNPDGMRSLLQSFADQPNIVAQIRELFKPESVQGFTVTDEKFRPLMSIGARKHHDPGAANTSIEDQALKYGGTINRWPLREIMLKALLQNQEGDALRAGVIYGKRMTSYEGGTKKIDLRFEDGSSETVDLMIAADGARSLVRKQRTPSLPFEPLGVMNLAGTLDFSEHSKFKKVRTAIFGSSEYPRPPHGVRMLSRTGTSVLLLPYRRVPDGQERLVSVVTFPAPNRDAQAFMRAESLDTDPKESPELVLILAQNTKRVCLDQAKAAQFDDEIIEMISSIDAADMFTNFGRDLSSIVPMSTNPFEDGPPLERGRVTMIGDALHAMTTHRGLGANTAFQDAADVAKAIQACVEEAHRQSGKLELASVALAIVNVERKMVKRGFANVAASKASTDSMTSAGFTQVVQMFTLRYVMGPILKLAGI